MERQGGCISGSVRCYEDLFLNFRILFDVSGIGLKLPLDVLFASMDYGWTYKILMNWARLSYRLDSSDYLLAQSLESYFYTALSMRDCDTHRY